MFNLEQFISPDMLRSPQVKALLEKLLPIAAGNLAKLYSQQNERQSTVNEFESENNHIPSLSEAKSTGPTPRSSLILPFILGLFLGLSFILFWSPY